MRRSAMVISGLAALILVWASAMAAPKATGRAKPAGKAKAAGPAVSLIIPPVGIPLSDWYDTIAKEAKPDANQLPKLKEKTDAAIAALAAWDKDNEPKLSAIQADLDKARQKSDINEVSLLSDRLKTARAGRDKLEADQQQGILAALTPEQKTRWEGYKLYVGMVAIFAKVNLTADQMTRLRLLADQGAAGIEKAETDEAKAAARRTLATDAMARVLTAAQRDELAGKKAAATGRPKTATKTTPAKKTDTRTKKAAGTQKKTTPRPPTPVPPTE